MTIPILLLAGVVYSQAGGGRQVSSGTSSCGGMRLRVTGGQFAPTLCVFEIISSGVDCNSAAGCPPSYALSLKDKQSAHIQEIALFGFKSFSKNTYRFDPSKNLSDFNGQLLDDRAIARHLLTGEVSLEPPAPENTSAERKAKISFDVSFSDNIRIEGSGEVPVRQVAAP